MEATLTNVFNKIMEVNECNNCSVNLLLIDSNIIRQLNKNFRDIDRPTKVLSLFQLISNYI